MHAVLFAYCWQTPLQQWSMPTMRRILRATEAKRMTALEASSRKRKKLLKYFYVRHGCGKLLEGNRVKACSGSREITNTWFCSDARLPPTVRAGQQPMGSVRFIAWLSALQLVKIWMPICGIGFIRKNVEYAPELIAWGVRNLPRSSQREVVFGTVQQLRDDWKVCIQRKEYNEKAVHCPCHPRRTEMVLIFGGDKFAYFLKCHFARCSDYRTRFSCFL